MSLNGDKHTRNDDGLTLVHTIGVLLIILVAFGLALMGIRGLLY